METVRTTLKRQILKASANAEAARSYFKPADSREHERANAGEDVPDYCINCRQPFMAHTNGACPKA